MYENIEKYFLKTYAQPCVYEPLNYQGISDWYSAIQAPTNQLAVVSASAGYSGLELSASKQSKDFLILKECAHLHPFVEEQINIHFQDKLIDEKNDRTYEDMIFDLQLIRRAMRLVKRFYQKKGVWSSARRK